ncbi:hypothetical protein AB7783_20010 [Tardiphaga sp. 172_B4_N1_3]|uniref:hypothetical protein n=1 Tax=Tardiphaga sp. 172_B4_N1_3 TaxID=3240787 RepID=UPI003F89A7F4
MGEIVLSFSGHPYMCEDCWLDSGKKVTALVRMMPEVIVAEFGNRKDYIGVEYWCCPCCYRPKKPVRKSVEKKPKDRQRSEYDLKWRKLYGGAIRGHQLCEWWDASVSDAEKARIRTARGNKSVDGVNSVPWLGGSSADYLSNLALHYVAPVDLILAAKLLDKSIDLVSEKDIPKSLSFHSNKIDMIFKASRGDEDLLPILMSACQAMIEYSRPRATYFKVPVAHVGYQKLYQHLISMGDVNGALSLAREALDGRWLGDWQRRVARGEKSIKPK